MSARMTFRNGDAYSLPVSDHRTIHFAGTGLTGEPVVNLLSAFPVVYYDLNKVTAHGSAGHPAYGEVSIAPFVGGLTIEKGVDVSYGNVQLNRVDGGAITLKGNSKVSHGSTVTFYGGRYQGDPVILDDSKLTVTGNSTADFTTTPIQGTGTITIDHGSTVDVKAITAGVRVNDSGTLNFAYGPIFPLTTAPINLNSNGVVDIERSPTVTRAVLHSVTDILDLMGPMAGAPPLMSIQFAGDPKLFVTPDGHGGMDITTHHEAGSLKTMILHS